MEVTRSLYLWAPALAHVFLREIIQVVKNLLCLILSPSYDSLTNIIKACSLNF